MTGPSVYSTEMASKLEESYETAELNLFDLDFECDNSWVPGFVAKTVPEKGQAEAIAQTVDSVSVAAGDANSHIEKGRELKTSLNDIREQFDNASIFDKEKEGEFDILKGLK